MAIQVIINQAGPLPIEATFEAPGDEPMYLEVNGSVWCEYADTMIGIGIDLDGQRIGAAQIFSNGSTTHRGVVPAYLPIQLSQGQHKLYLYLNTGETVSDGNDFYTAVLHY
jgi:hypothetical protein